MAPHVLTIVQADASLVPDAYNDAWMADLKLLLSTFIVLNILFLAITTVVMCNVFNRLKKQEAVITQYGVKIDDLNFLVGHQSITLRVVCSRIGWTIGSRQVGNPAPTEHGRDADAVESGTM